MQRGIGLFWSLSKDLRKLIYHSYLGNCSDFCLRMPLHHDVSYEQKMNGTAKWALGAVTEGIDGFVKRAVMLK